MAASPEPAPKEPQVVVRLASWWHRRIEPHPSIPEANRYAARLLASLQIVVLAMSLTGLSLTLAGVFPIPGDLRQLTVRLTALVSIGLLGGYALGRIGRFYLSAYLTVGLSLAGALIGVLENPASPMAPVFVILGGLLSGLFLSTFATVLVFALTVVLVSLIAPSVASLPSAPYLTLVFYLTLVGFIMVMASLQRENRNQQIQAQARQLADRQLRLEHALRSGESASQEMIRSLQELDRVQRDTGWLSEWSEMMHACAAPQDIFPVVQHFGQRLFPKAGGGLYLYSSSRNDLEFKAGWGTPPSRARFPAEACWGLRRGQLHRVDAGSPDGPGCDHLPALPEATSLCAPLMAHNEILGLLCLTFPGPIPPPAADLVADASRRVAVALANLQLREILRHQSLRDPMTNLYNRRVMEAMLLQEIHRSQRSQRPFSVLMIDLDHFKPFNDDHGHPAGDLLLQQIAALIVSRVRASDVVCRYGGEELVVILVEAALQDAVRRAESLRQEIGQLRVDYHGVLLRPVTCSIGVASYPMHAASPDLLIHAADTALYQAKNAGRNCIRHPPVTETVD